MPIFSRLIFYAVRWSARRGFHDADAHNDAASPNAKLEKKEKARRTGMRGETYGYWYLATTVTSSLQKTTCPSALKASSTWSATTAKPSHSSKSAHAPSPMTPLRSPRYLS